MVNYLGVYITENVSVSLILEMVSLALQIWLTGVAISTSDTLFPCLLVSICDAEESDTNFYTFVGNICFKLL